jgi:hypothetical protein
MCTCRQTGRPAFVTRKFRSYAPAEPEEMESAGCLRELAEVEFIETTDQFAFEHPRPFWRERVVSVTSRMRADFGQRPCS